MTVTDQDRETAARVLKVSRGLARMATDVELVAAALADEREKALAPFRELAEFLTRPPLSEREGDRPVSEATIAVQNAAELIRRVLDAS